MTCCYLKTKRFKRGGTMSENLRHLACEYCTVGECNIKDDKPCPIIDTVNKIKLNMISDIEAGVYLASGTIDKAMELLMPLIEEKDSLKMYKAILSVKQSIDASRKVLVDFNRETCYKYPIKG